MNQSAIYRCVRFLAHGRVVTRKELWKLRESNTGPSSQLTDATEQVPYRELPRLGEVVIVSQQSRVNSLLTTRESHSIVFLSSHLIHPCAKAAYSDATGDYLFKALACNPTLLTDVLERH